MAIILAKLAIFFLNSISADNELNHSRKYEKPQNI